jgi:thiol-disulfide isomerase/thioredoxin
MIRATGLFLIALAAGAQAATIPRQSPEFVIRSPGGEVLLSQFRGNVVLLAFIHTTCPHCQQSVGLMSALQKEYGPRGFQPLASAFNEMAAQVLPDFVTRFRPTFPVGYTSRDTVNDYLQVPSNTPYRIPIYIFIDRKGMIREQHLGEEAFFADEAKNTRAILETLLKEPALTKKGGKKGPAPSKH